MSNAKTSMAMATAAPPCQLDLFAKPAQSSPPSEAQRSRPAKAGSQSLRQPDRLGKAVRLPVPDFSDPGRRPTCLETDFPIAQINALSNLEGNAGKPIYQMSKWWARRRSSVFRSLLIAAATEAPDDPGEASKLVWDHYYCNHQKAGSFRHLSVLDCFMGGGTTLVEGARLGMRTTGVDLNPVAWLVVRNELAGSDPEQVKALFAAIERQVKPQVQPFYATSCPRGHQGRWIEIQTGQPADLDPVDLPPEQRARFRWEGPETIYTFWAKHGPCQNRGCGHRTPIFRSPVVAEKKLVVDHLELTCPSCGASFHAELGETRMAPGAERATVGDELPFAELTQAFARLLHDYDKGAAEETLRRAQALKAASAREPGLHCPGCGVFAGQRLADVLAQHARPGLGAGQRRKKAFGLRRKPVHMHLLIHPEWMRGASGLAGDQELGGWAGAPAKATAQWMARRLEHLKLIEVRGKELPETVVLKDGTRLETGRGTVPKKAHFACASCGREGNTLDSVRLAKHTAPVAAYAMQCHCPQCETEGFAYGGRYFKVPDEQDVMRMERAEREWERRREDDLALHWPRQEVSFAHETHVRRPMDQHGYTHWWKFFNPRQLLVHAQLLKAIVEASESDWPLDVREQALGAFQQYLRNQNMFAFYHVKRDCLAPALSNSNFHPKNAAIEVSVYSEGYGPWKSTSNGILGGLEWARVPWEPFIREESGQIKSFRMATGDPILPVGRIHCGSSTDLTMLGSEQFDLVITDPPFGNNIFYADLADFFYVWLRIALRKWHAGQPEAAYFEPERTPHSMEAIDNPAEHPDDREAHEKNRLIAARHLAAIQELAKDDSLAVQDPNPLFRPPPSSEFYCQTLAAVWTEARQRLKDGGIMAFTFHHNEDQAWVDVLQALFDAGYVLVATYPIRSDETKGATAAFGSQKIEYDIVHVCRKRLEWPKPASWARMRRWVKEETVRLKALLEHVHGKDLLESDLRVILRGKSLEFYSRHYGQVLTGEGETLSVRDALLGINQLLDDLLEEGVGQRSGLRPPDRAEPASRLHLRLFRDRTSMDRDELHKMLRGTGIPPGELEARGWIRIVGRMAHAATVAERFACLAAPGRTRKAIKTDLDQAYFLIGAALPNSGVKIDDELDNPNFQLKKATEEILRWHAETEGDLTSRLAASTALQLIERWRRMRKERPQPAQQRLFDLLEESE